MNKICERMRYEFISIYPNLKKIPLETGQNPEKHVFLNPSLHLEK